MENPKLSQIEDIRQSKHWEEFLKWCGWKCERTKRGILVSFINSPFGKLGKVQRPTKIEERDLKQIDEVCKRNKCSVVKIEPSLSQDLSIFENNGLLRSFRPLLPPATIMINLKKSEDELWSDISKSGKYSIRRAKREGAKIKTYRKPPDKILKEFIELTNQTRKDRKYVGASLEDLKTKVKHFGKDSYIIFVQNKKSENLVSNMYFTHKKGVWYLHGGTSSKGRKTKAGYELVWRSILYFKEKGFDFLDLDGVDDDRFGSFTKSWGPFSHFKEKFSKEKTYFPIPYVKIYNPFIKLITKVRGKNTL